MYSTSEYELSDLWFFSDDDDDGDASSPSDDEMSSWHAYPLSLVTKKESSFGYERSHKSLNSYSLVEYDKIYPNTNSCKTLQEESLW